MLDMTSSVFLQYMSK